MVVTASLVLACLFTPAHVYAAAPAPTLTSTWGTITPTGQAYAASATQLYFNPTVAGNVVLTVNATDTTSYVDSIQWPGTPRQYGWWTENLPGGWSRAGLSVDDHGVGNPAITVGEQTNVTRSRTLSWTTGGATGTTWIGSFGDAPCCWSAHVNNAHLNYRTLTFTKDNTAPAASTAAITYLDQPAWSGPDVTVTRSGTMTDAGADMRGYQIQRDTRAMTGTTCPTTGWPGTWGVDVGAPVTTLAGVTTDTGVPTGCYKYQVEGSDNVNNTRAVGASPSTRIVKVDATLPTGAITTPAAGFVRGMLTFTGTASDAHSGVQSVVLTADGAPFVTCTWSAGNYTCPSYDSTTVPNGNYTLRVVVTDNVGNVFTGPAHVVTVDNAAPTSTVTIAPGTLPLNQFVVPGTVPIVYVNTAAGPSSSFTVSTTLADGAGSGSASATYPLSLGASWTRSGVSGAGNGPWLATYTWTPGAANPGVQPIATADAIGNVGAASFDVRADLVAPVIGTASLGTLPAWDDATITLSGTGTMTDAASGMRSMQVQRESGTLTGATCGGWAGGWVAVGGVVTAPATLGTINDGGKANGTCHRYRVLGTDNVGNTFPSPVSTTVGVDIGAPTGTIAAFPTGAVSGTTVAISGTAADDYVGFGASTSSGGRVVVRWRNTATMATGTIATRYGPNAAPAWSTTWNSTSVVDGPYEIIIDVVDDVGNTTNSAALRTVTVDNSPPVITLTSLNPIAPAGCQYWSGLPSVMLFYNTSVAATCGAGSFSIDVAASDAPGGLAEVTFPDAAYISAGLVPTPQNDLVAPYTSTYTYTGASSSNQVHNVTAVGNSGRTTDLAINFMLDAVAPVSMAVTSPGSAASPGWWSNATSVPVGFTNGVDAATGSFVASGVASQQLQRRSAPRSGAACGAWTAWGTIVTDPAGASYPDGSIAADTCYQYGMVTTDRVRNAGSALDTTTTLRVDRTAPTGAVNPQPPFVRDTITVDGVHADDWSGVATATLLVDGTPSACVATPAGSPTASTPWTCSVDTTALSDGPHTFSVRVVDRAGTTYTSPTVATTVDNLLPTATIALAEGTNPDNQFLVPGPVPRMYVNTGATFTGSFTATATITDANGVASATFPALGGGWTIAPIGGIVANPGPYTATYAWTGGGGTSDPGIEGVVVADTAGNLGNASFEVIADTAAPSGASIDQPNGPDSAPSISFVTGSDAGAGIRTWRLQRQEAPSPSAGTCGAFGAWANQAAADLASPYVDATVTTSRCYRYQLLVTDNVGNVAVVGDGTDTVIVEPAGLVVTENGAPVKTAVAEGGTTDTYTVALRSRPTATVTVTLTTGGQTTVAPTTLTFTTANWMTPQTVTVTAVDDDVDEVPDPHADTITHAISSSDTDYDALADVPVAVEVTDNDVAAFVVSADVATIAVSEAGATSDGYTIRLATQPTGSVTVTLGNIDGQVLFAPATLTFGPADWSTPKAVTVTAVNDALAEAATHPGTVTHAVTGIDPVYAGLTIPSAVATVTDDDNVGVTVTPTSGLAIAEAGATSATYTIVLTSQPSSSVTITPVGDADASVAPSPIVFTTANWMTPRTITVTAIDDALVEGPHVATISHIISSLDGAYGAFAVPPVTADVTDDDTPGLDITPTSGLAVHEGIVAPESNYRIRLRTQPTSDVVITFTSGPDLVAIAPLTFTSANWNVFQDVPLGAVDDAVDEAPIEVATIQHVVTGDATYVGLVVADQSVDVHDDDDAGYALVDAGAGSVTVAEAGATSDTFTIRLTSQPTADVVLTPTPDSQVLAAPATLTFTSVNWATPQTVTITAVDDGIDEALVHPGLVTLVASTLDTTYQALAAPSITVDVADDDTAAIVFSTTGPLAVAEAGATSATYTVRLATQPAADVTLAVATASGQVGVGPATLTFTPIDWATPKTVTVTAIDDAIVEPDPHGALVTTTVSASADAAYFAFAGSVPDVTVDVDDDDAPSVVVDPGSGVAVAEAGGTDTYTVVLGARPRVGETVTVTPTTDAQVTAAPTTLTFTYANWNVPQTVTVSAVDDLVSEPSPHPGVVTHAVTSTDALWSSLTSAASVTAQVTDNDIPAVQVTPTSVAVSEAGTTATYTIVLATQPTAPVDVAIAAAPIGQVTTNAATITFTTGNWNVAQTITVTAIDDAVTEGPHAVTITHVASSVDSAYDGITVAPVAVAITDNDAVGIDVSPTTGLTAHEDGSVTASYGIRLLSQPLDDVVVSFATGSQLAPIASITFTPATWNVVQSVTAIAIDDDVDEASPHPGTIVHTVASPGDPAYAALTIADQTVAITDDDDAGYELVDAGAGQVAVAEAGATSDTYTIRLISQPTADVVITLVPDAQVTVGAPTLTFTSANWNVFQTVTVSAVNDAIDEAAVHPGLIGATVASADATYQAAAVPAVTVDVADDDDAAVTFSTLGPLAVAESGATSATYTMRLATQPLADVAIAVAPGVGQVTVGPTTLTFTPINWATPQTVTVTAIDDPDVELDPHAATISATVSASVDPAYLALAGTLPDVDVAVDDDDAPSVVVDPGTGVAVTEAGGTDTYTVVLGARPRVGETVTVTPTADAQVTTSPATLTFTNANWNLPQTVTVSAVDDLVSEASPHPGVVTHAVTSTDTLWSALTSAASVTAQVTDNDIPAVQVAPTTLTVTESGTTASYTIVLATQPTASVDISVGSTPAGQLTTSVPTVTFTSGNWNVPQTIVVTAVDDFITEGPHGATLAHVATSADGTYDAIAVDPVAVSITDNDSVGIDVTPTTGLVAHEDGSVTSTYGMRLLSQPIDDVVVSFATGSQLAPIASLTFTPATWNVVQSVTVAAVDDDIDEASPHVGTIVHTVTSAGDLAYAGYPIPDQLVDITDDDDAGFELVDAAPGEVAVAEAGATSDTFTIRLTSAPSADVVLTLAPDAQITASPTTITFTGADWNVFQTVTVGAVDDDVDEAAVHPGLLGMTLASADTTYGALVTPAVVADVADDDIAAVNVEPGTLALDETGPGTDTYEVVLASQPTSPVTVTLTPDAQLTALPTSLVFTPATWNVPQVVTATAVDDTDVESSPHPGTITHVVTTADLAYQLVAVGPKLADIIDNDVPAVLVDDLGGVAVSEDGTVVDTYGVVLGARPAADVVVTLAFDPTQLLPTPMSLTFTSANWNVSQFVSVAGVQDLVVEADPHVSTITHTVTSADPLWASVTSADPIPVSIDDDDVAGVSVTPTVGLVVDEAGPATATYSVVLLSQPTADVTIALTGDGQVAPSPAMLTFTSANWNVPQSVVVAGVDDAVVEGLHAGTISHVAASADPTYDALAIATQTIGVTDDDVAGVDMTPTSGLAVAEGGATTTYDLRLTGRPDADVVVSFATGSQLAPIASVTFTSANWNVVQGVTVAAVDDDVDESSPHTGTISHTVTSTATGYGAVTMPDQLVDITDDDDAGIELVDAGAGQVAVAESGATSDTFTIRLTSQPTADVVVTLVPDVQVSVGATTVTFTSANWNVFQTVTVTAVDDVASEAAVHPGLIAMTLASADATYQALPLPTVTADVTDNDLPGVVFSPAGPLAVAEAGATSATYTVTLASQPTSDVTVSATPDAQVTSTPASITFTPANWNVPVTVTVTAVDDPVVEAPIHPGSISHDVVTSDPVYQTLAGTLPPMPIDVSDDDLAAVLYDPAGGPEVTEGGTAHTYHLVLAGQPTQDVVVTITPDTQVTVGATTITFTPANWNVPQDVVVTAVDDAIAEVDPLNVQVTHAVASSDPQWASVTSAPPASVIVHDDDVAGILVTPTGPYAFDEASPYPGTSGTYSVVLVSQPTADVVVTLAVPGDVGVSTPVLTFTSATWNVPQIVTFGALDDDVVEASPHLRTITHASASADPAYAPGVPVIDPVTMSITDDDVAGVVVSRSSLAVVEGGATDSFDVSLLSQPTGDVVVTLGGTQVTSAPTTLTFTTANWNVAQPVVVTAIDDEVDETPDPHAGSVSFAVASADAAYDLFSVPVVPVAITDDDAAGVLVTPGATVIAVDEAGTTTATYTVVLRSQPTADVTITVGTADGQTTVDTPTLTFTDATWNVPQTVTVTGVQDTIDESNPHAALVTHVAASADTHYDAIAIIGQAVEVADDDDAGIVVTPPSGTQVTEGGAGATVDVRLATQPAGPVTITIGTDAQSVVGGSATLTFTPGDWNLAQTVALDAVNDQVDEASPHPSVVTYVATSVDPAYAALAPLAVTIDVVDDDAAGISVVESGGSTDIAEGAPGTTDTFQVRLDTQPVADVTVTITGGLQATAVPVTLTFTPLDWNTPRSVTVTAANDWVVEGLHTQAFTLVAASSDGMYDALAGPGVTANITDDDAAGVVITPVALALDEDATVPVTYSVVLTAQPTQDVLVTLGPDGQVAPDAPTLLFTAANWNVPQDVDVLAVDDAVVEGLHVGTITHVVTSADLAFDGVAASDVVVSITDDDSAGVDVTPTSITVGEGGPDGTYTVVLRSQPSAPVDVVFASTGGQLAPIAPITFQPADWNVPQTVTVMAIDDLVVEGAHAATITHDTASADPVYAPATQVITPVTVDIVDNDIPSIVLTPPTGVSGNEGDVVSYGISLGSQPTAPVTVTLQGTDADGTPVTTSVVFDAATWSMPQQVDVQLVQDAIVEGAHATTIAHVVTSADTAYDGFVAPAQTIDILDDDVAGVAFTPAAPGPLAIAEGGATASYDITLLSEPLAPVTIDIAAMLGQATAMPASVTFAPGAWNLPQTVVVTATDDLVDEPAIHNDTLGHVATSTDPVYAAIAIQGMALDIADNDDAGIVLTHTGADTTVTENGTGDDVEVVLATRPLQDVIVTFTGAQVEAGVASITFTPATWNVPQLVPVTAIDDAIFEGPHAGTLQATSAGLDPAYVGVASTPLPVDVIDDDVAGVIVTQPTAPDVAESSPAVGTTYQLRLRSQPVADVTVTLLPDAQVTTTPTSVTFTASDWNVDQDVTVYAVDDLIAEADPHPGHVAHDTTSADAGYGTGTLTIDDAVVSIDDDDTPGIIVDTIPMHALTEGGATSTYTIRLASQPTAPVTITPVSSQLTWAPITFTGLDWMTPQTITLAAIDDDVAEGSPHPGSLTHLVTSADAGYDGFVTTDVHAQITDDDVAGLVATPTSGLAVDEAATLPPATYVLTLSSQPSAPVTVTMSPDLQVAVDSPTVVLDAANWNTGVVVTITAIDDAVAEAATHPGIVTHAMASTDPGYDGLAGPAVTADVTDDDVAGATITESGTTDVAEDGSVADAYQVVLTSQPTSPVTITMGTVDGQVAVVPATLTFTAANWDQPQTVAVTAVDDDVDEAAIHPGTITHDAASADPRYDGGALPMPVVVANVTDDDAAGIVVDPASVAVAEGGTTDSVVLRLASRPTAPVELTLSPDAQLTTTPTVATIAPAAWSTGVTVAVEAVDDALIEGPHSGTVTIAITGGDATYLALTPPAPITATIDDNDSASVVVAQTGAGASVAEAGTTSDTFTVRLSAQPTAPVVVDLATDAAQLGLAPASLTFDASNWSTPRTVTVTAIDDDVDEADPHVATIAFTITTADPDFGPVTVAPVDVSIADDDDAGVSVTPAVGLAVTEGGAPQAVQVRLTSRPLGPVQVSFAGDLQVDVLGAPIVLLFDATTWDTPQVVSIVAIDDDIDEPNPHAGSVTATTASATDPAYGPIAPVTMPVAVTDNDDAAIVVTPRAGSDLDEADVAGTERTVDVVLGSEPLQPVTLTFDGGSQLTPQAPSTLTFTPANWDTPQPLAIRAVDDSVDEASPHTGTLTWTVTGDAAYVTIGGSTASFDILDDDAAGVVIDSLATHAVTEGGATSTYTIHLASRPTAAVTISIASPGGQLEAPADVVIQPADWDQPVTVIVRAVDDAATEPSPHPGVLHHVSTSTDPAYDAVVGMADVLADITDDDPPSWDIQGGGTVEVDEAGPTSDTYTFALGAQPSSPVTIDFAHVGGQVVVAPSTHTFTPADWNVPVTVTVTAVDDPDVEATLHDATITHTVAAGSNAAYLAATIPDVVARVRDDDTAAVLVTPTTPLAVAEAGATSATASLYLAARPKLPVTVTLAVDAQLTLGATTLTFTPANWSTPQDVAVTAVDDAMDEADPHAAAVSVTTASADPDFDSLTTADIAVSIADDDDAGIELTGITGLTLDEADTLTTRTIRVRLTAAPSSPVRITPGAADGQTQVGAMLVFTPANWSTFQDVLVVVEDDDLVEAPVHVGRVTFTVASSDVVFDGMAIAPVDIDISDDDTAEFSAVPGAGWTAAPAPIVLTEGGTSARLTVRLGGAPSGPVTITPVLGPTGQLAVAPASVTFDTAGGAGQQVEFVFTAVDDAIDETSPMPGSIGWSVTGADPAYSAAATDLEDRDVSIIDDDVAGVVVTPASVDLAEGGAAGEVTVVLASEPTAPVLVNLTPDAQVETDAAAVSFLPSNWSTPQRIRVTAIDDDIVEASPHPGIVAASVTSTDAAFAAITLADMTAQITDNDQGGVEVLESGTSTRVTEAGGSDTISVRLRARPTQDVTVTLGPDSQITATPVSLTFTATSWSTAQVATIRAVQDDIVEGAHEGLLSVGVTSMDTIFASAAAPAAVRVEVVDDDVAGIDIVATGGTTQVAEAGATDTVAVVLTGQPASDVVVAFDGLGQATFAPASLTFTSANWNVPQAITVGAVQDSIDEADPHAIAAPVTVTSMSAAWRSLTPTPLAVSIADDDTTAIEFAQTDGSTRVVEGGAGDTVTVRLATRPTAPVTITTVGDAQVAGGDPVVIDPAAFAKPVELAISAIDDKVVEGEHRGTVSFTVTGTDPTYAAQVIPPLDVAVGDNDSVVEPKTEAPPETVKPDDVVEEVVTDDGFEDEEDDEEDTDPAQPAPPVAPATPTENERRDTSTRAPASRGGAATDAADRAVPTRRRDATGTTNDSGRTRGNLTSEPKSEEDTGALAAAREWSDGNWQWVLPGMLQLLLLAAALYFFVFDPIRRHRGAVAARRLRNGGQAAGRRRFFHRPPRRRRRDEEDEDGGVDLDDLLP